MWEVDVACHWGHWDRSHAWSENRKQWYQNRGEEVLKFQNKFFFENSWGHRLKHCQSFWKISQKFYEIFSKLRHYASHVRFVFRIGASYLSRLTPSSALRTEFLFIKIKDEQVNKLPHVWSLIRRFETNRYVIPVVHGSHRITTLPSVKIRNKLKIISGILSCRLIGVC